MSGSMKPRQRRLSVKILICFSILFYLAMDVCIGFVLTKMGNHVEREGVPLRISSPAYHHGFAPFKHDPNQKWGPYKSAYFINSLGFRDYSTNVIPLVGNKQRLLVIGDSFTEGIGVNYENTFAGIIAKNLETNGIEILNAGVSSYSPAIYNKKLKYLIDDLGLHVDRVCIFLDMSDITDECIYADEPDSNNASSMKKTETPNAWLSWRHVLKTYSLTGKCLSLVFGKIKQCFPELVWKMSLNQTRCLWGSNPELWNTYGNRGLHLATDNMNRINAFLKQKKISLTVAVYPWPDQIVLRETHGKQVDHWELWTRTNHVGFINYFPQFINASNSAQSVIAKYFIAGDIHWNIAGHQLIAMEYLRNMPKIEAWVFE